MKRKIREFGRDDIDLIINYFLKADLDFLRQMGVDPEKLPPPAEWKQFLLDDLASTDTRKAFLLPDMGTERFSCRPFQSK